LQLKNYIFTLLSSLPLYGLGNDIDSGIVISDHSEKYFVNPKLMVYKVGPNAINAKLALDYYNAGKFRLVRKANSEYMNLGLLNSGKWFAVPLFNESSQEVSVILEFITADKNSILCYAVSDTRKLIPLLSAENNSSSGNPSLLSHSQTFTAHLQPGRATILLFNTINRGQILYFSNYLYTVSAFRKYDLLKINFLGLFKGVFLFIIVFSLFLYLATKDNIYIYYLVYAFFISVFALNEAGNAYFEPAPLKWLNHISGQSYLMFGFSAWLLLMAEFLNLIKLNSPSLKFIKILFFLNLFFGLVPVLSNGFIISMNIQYQHLYQNLFSILFISNLIFIFSTIFYEIRNKNKLAIFYAVANIPVFTGTILYYSNYFNLTSVYFHWINPVALGLSVEIFLLSFGFAFRYQMMGKEKQFLLQQVYKQQEELTTQVIQTQESERKRIAQDLHDELGGNLAALKIAIQRIKLEEHQKDVLNSIILRTSQAARNIAHNLMPPEFSQTGLDKMLKNYFIELNHHKGDIKFYFHIVGDTKKFEKHKELTIYRIVLELTNNIIKHSLANEANIQLIYDENKITLMAEDNGQGFDQNIVNEGIGLRNIQTRVSILKGTLAIDSGICGTTTIIQIPIYDEKN
jgi:signal transduction histidine kinase